MSFLWFSFSNSSEKKSWSKASWAEQRCSGLGARSFFKRSSVLGEVEEYSLSS